MNIRRLLKIIGLVICLVWFLDALVTIHYEQPRMGPREASRATVAYAGAVHVHSRYSDGGGTMDEIILAAQNADLDFLIMTDHSTVQPLTDGYQGYHDDLMVIVGEEVNTGAGHLLALGLNRHVEQQGDRGLPALLDTIDAAGGIAILAHPTGRRPWTDWTAKPVHGLELLNADTAWRDDGLLEWLRALLFLAVMPQGALNSLIDRPDQAIDRWQTMRQERHFIGIGSVDAHARIPLWGDQMLRFPSYERMFNLLRTYVVTDSALTGDSDADRQEILNALKEGRCYAAVDGYEKAASFEFELRAGNQIYSMGSRTAFQAGGQLCISAPSSGDVMIRLYRNGELAAESYDQTLNFDLSEPGIYHAEAYQLRPRLLRSDEPGMWVISNAIWVE